MREWRNFTEGIMKDCDSGRWLGKFAILEYWQDFEEMEIILELVRFKLFKSYELESYSGPSMRDIFKFFLVNALCN